MRFQPKSEKQIQEERFPVLSPGKYPFEITDAKEDVSKSSGNPMIVLKIKIMDQELNALTYVRDYIMESIPYKLRHAAFACELGDRYDSGDLDAHMFVGKTGTLELVIQKDKSGKYPDKNSVQDYLLEDSSEQKKQSSPSITRNQAESWEEDLEMPPWVR